jgi:alpha-L-rhamnosidase
VPYAGPALEPDATYRWTVQTWAASGGPGPLAPSATFDTGLRDADWKAQWIWRATSLQPDQYTYVRKEVTLGAAPIVRARAYVSGDQQYELYVNGTRAGKGQAYCYPDSQYYETLDVTTLLTAGSPNAVALLYGWQGATKGHPAGHPGCIVQVSILHSDGSTELIVTDGTWRALAGAWLPGTERDLEGDKVDYTENIDGPRIPVGWESPGFDDSGWLAASVLGPAGVKPWTHLVSVRTRIVEEPVMPVSLTTLSSGAVVADFGKVYAAVPTVTFHRGVAGRVITMRAGYVLDESGDGVPFPGLPGQVSTVHATQHTNMRYSYVQRGGTEEEFHPFDFLGFRYFQIDNPGEVLAPTDIVALSRHTAVPDENAGSFASSEPTVDAIFELGRHSALFCAQEQYLDTPTREKGPWLWDGFNESRTAMSSLADQNLSRKSLQEFAASQARYWPSGAINKIYPTGLGAEDIDESCEIYAEWVWQYWLHTGDRPLLQEVYPVLVKLSGYVHGAVDRSTGLVTGLQTSEASYPYRVATRLNILGANVFRRTADVAEALGRPSSEVTRQRGRQAALTAALNQHLTRSDGIYVDGLVGHALASRASQEVNACAVVYGVVPTQHLKAVGSHVAGLGMHAEPQTAAEVIRTLATVGDYDQLLVRLTDRSTNGWANILARGATFCWEVWQPSDANGDSMSHGWGSNVLVEIQQWLLGVRPSGAGFETFDVAPPASGPMSAIGTVPTPRGTVVVGWRRAAKDRPATNVDLIVPPNATATLFLAGVHPDTVTESGTPVEKVAGVRVAPSVADAAVLLVGAGTYHFEGAVTRS